MPSPARNPSLDAQTAPPAVHRLTVPSPVGALILLQENEAISRVFWAAGARTRNAMPTPLLAEAARQLTAYFSGALKRFDLALAPAGTPYQRRVWTALNDISYGVTETYGELAARLGTAPRAVGRACGANPIPIIVPCHRVLAAGDTLHGYSGGGGIATKAKLLGLERARPAS